MIYKVGWLTTKSMDIINIIYLDQFSDHRNSKSHEDTTGMEIIRQLNGWVGAYFGVVGIGGIVIGTGRLLKERCKSRRIGVDVKGGIIKHRFDGDTNRLHRPFNTCNTGCVLAGIKIYLNMLDNESTNSQRRIQGPIVAVAADTGMKYTGSSLDTEFLDRHQIQHILYAKTKTN
ncbi:unnamed protein product [Didymodactylos carnosus]|uniref:Uncharacterized protein n=1 Tax=Didymodactylos carnosus TaxID=1234261 RepID=A0A815NGV3_9BILA|nr:unnamed protein product [Didymodactylos carnosus]CAF1436335.1 unnamed protein product [Didymodactylos carnosus]CAF3971497.1 unnamed protein product [Didymodactylos carnosus]CAF4313718.1 unnamed protein product [Didymodactylos carnosus]